MGVAIIVKAKDLAYTKLFIGYRVDFRLGGLNSVLITAWVGIVDNLRLVWVYLGTETWGR